MTNEQENHFSPLGTHLIQIDGDSVYFIARGDLKLDEMRTLLDLFPRLQADGPLFILYDARQCTGITADARRLAATQPTSAPAAELQVVFGLSFGVRVILKMLLRANQVLQNRPALFHTFDDETKARTFFESERVRIRQLKKSPS